MSIHQAVILTAGQGSRFAPLVASEAHKSEYEIMGVPLIIRTIRKLIGLGIEEILIVKSPTNLSLPQIVDQLHLSVKVIFINQQEPRGMGDGILSARDYLQSTFLVINPQQINIDSHFTHLKNIPNIKDQVVIFSQKTDHPEKYGMLRLKDNRVIGVVEKPSELTGLSNQRILGIYILTQEFVSLLTQTIITETQLEIALDLFVHDHEILCIESPEDSLSLKYPWDVFPIISYLMRSFLTAPSIHPGAIVHKTAILTGAVVVEEGASIHAYAIIEGPCYIGKNAVIGSYCKVRKESVIEEGVQLQNNVEVKHSHIGRGTHVHSGFIGDSLIGRNVRIGAGFVTANRRLDRAPISIIVKGKKISTDSTSFGALIGDEAKIGIHCGVNPGVIVSNNSVIYPGTIITS